MRWTGLLCSALLASGAIIVLGCGDDDGGSASDKPTATTRSTPDRQTETQEAPDEVPAEKPRCSRGTTVAHGKRDTSQGTATVNRVVSGSDGICLRVRSPSAQQPVIFYRTKCTLASGRRESLQGSEAGGGPSLRFIRTPKEAGNDKRCRVTVRGALYVAGASTNTTCDSSGCSVTGAARSAGDLRIAIIKPG